MTETQEALARAAYDAARAAYVVANTDLSVAISAAAKAAYDAHAAYKAYIAALEPKP